MDVRLSWRDRKPDVDGWRRSDLKKIVTFKSYFRYSVSLIDTWLILDIKIEIIWCNYRLNYLPSMLVASPTSLNLRPGVARPLSWLVVGYTGRRYCPGWLVCGWAELVVVPIPDCAGCSSVCEGGTEGVVSSSAGAGSLARRRKEPRRCLCSQAFWRTLSSFLFFSNSYDIECTLLRT